ncbi:hypothetical protein PAMP_018649 [Pampus punctatissimus]
MSGPVVFQMWMVLVLGSITGVGRAQVSTAKVLRGNIRRDVNDLLNNRDSEERGRKEELRGMQGSRDKTRRCYLINECLATYHSIS